MNTERKRNTPVIHVLENNILTDTFSQFSWIIPLRNKAPFPLGGWTWHGPLQTGNAHRTYANGSALSMRPASEQRWKFAITLQEWTQMNSAVHEQRITGTRAQEFMVCLLKYFVTGYEIDLVYLYRAYRHTQYFTCKSSCSHGFVIRKKSL